MIQCQMAVEQSGEHCYTEVDSRDCHTPLLIAYIGHSEKMRATVRFLIHIYCISIAFCNNMVTVNSITLNYHDFALNERN